MIWTNPFTNYCQLISELLDWIIFEALGFLLGEFVFFLMWRPLAQLGLQLFVENGPKRYHGRSKRRQWPWPWRWRRHRLVTRSKPSRTLTGMNRPWKVTVPGSQFMERQACLPTFPTIGSEGMLNFGGGNKNENYGISSTNLNWWKHDFDR